MAAMKRANTYIDKWFGSVNGIIPSQQGKSKFKILLRDVFKFRVHSTQIELH